jgi:hypothetical protein
MICLLKTRTDILLTTYFFRFCLKKDMTNAAYNTAREQFLKRKALLPNENHKKQNLSGDEDQSGNTIH